MFSGRNERTLMWAWNSILRRLSARLRCLHWFAPYTIFIVGRITQQDQTITILGIICNVLAIIKIAQIMFAIKMQLMYYCMYINIDQQTIKQVNVTYYT
jgi:hypothetical protein